MLSLITQACGQGSFSLDSSSDQLRINKLGSLLA